MGKNQKSYLAGQSLHNKVEVDEYGNRTITHQVIYETKEYVDGYVDVRLPKKHKFNNGGFITVFQKAFTAIAMHCKLTKNELNLLLLLIGSAGMDCSVRTNLDELGEALCLSKSQTSKALKGLVQRNIVIREDGNRYDRQPLRMDLTFNYDQLNYNIAYNGKTANFKRKRIEHPALSIPGASDGEWIDMDTGVVTIEKDGQVVQEALPSNYEINED
ncbi:transcriptional regulator TrmB [Porphyromonas sp. CAG:1061]|uniref:TrmB family transcriptional regulator n=1 Tax=Porphyromonas sp. CAG:1061 TaxID=1262916 RepID=UPI000337F49D|nr:TrmB family transcriptional regulator [Porphyromonas sp. CAG:1061]CCY08643.1 transcriptional regulator TrmB [Porphyromonas sp. CAG:1061]